MSALRSRAMVEFEIDAPLDPGSAPQWFGRWSALADVPELTFVLPKKSLHAFELVLIGALAADRRRRHLESRVDAGSTNNPLAQLLIRASSASTRSAGAGGELALLRPVTDLRTARLLADVAADALSEVNPPLSPSIVRMTRFVFEELGANVIQHSGRPETGYGFVAVDPSRRRLELAFADCGTGFRASLQRNPELEGRVSDDAEALQLALSPRISGTSSPRTNMGVGLKLLVDFSDLMGGDLWLASGSAMLQRKSTAGQRTNLIRTIAPWRGSWICLDAPLV
jgi:hypothetical protein